MKYMQSVILTELIEIYQKYLKVKSKSQTH